MYLGDISTSEKNLTKSDTTEESGYHNTAYDLANREYNRDKSIRSNQRPSTAQSQSSSSSLLKLNQFEPKSDHLDTFGMKRPYSAFEVNLIVPMLILRVLIFSSQFRIKVNFQTPTKESIRRSLRTLAERGILASHPVVPQYLSTLKLLRVD